MTRKEEGKMHNLNNIKILMVAVSILALLLGCQTMTGTVKESKGLQPVSVKLVELTKVFAGKEAIVVDMLFAISNPNPIPVNVTQLEWTVSVEKIRLGTLAVSEGIYIPAKKEAQTRKTYFLNAGAGPVNLLLAGQVINLEKGAEVFGGISKAIAEDKASWVLDGAAFVDSDWGSSSTTFTAEWK
jgi:LEA14-like dessication related protein